MLVKVRVKAGARNERIAKSPSGYDIEVREAAAGGMANARVLALLARELGISPKKLRIVKGQRSPTKTISIAS